MLLNMEAFRSKGEKQSYSCIVASPLTLPVTTVHESASLSHGMRTELGEEAPKHFYAATHLGLPKAERILTWLKPPLHPASQRLPCPATLLWAVVPQASSAYTYPACTQGSGTAIIFYTIPYFSERILTSLF